MWAMVTECFIRSLMKYLVTTMAQHLWRLALHGTRHRTASRFCRIGFRRIGFCRIGLAASKRGPQDRRTRARPLQQFCRISRISRIRRIGLAASKRGPQDSRTSPRTSRFRRFCRIGLRPPRPRARRTQ